MAEQWNRVPIDPHIGPTMQQFLEWLRQRVSGGLAGETGATGPQGPAGESVSLPITNKGDLLTMDTFKIFRRFGQEGSNNLDVLTRDDSRPLGLKWKTLSIDTETSGPIEHN